MEYIVDKHMIRVLRDIVMEYVDDYRVKYDHSVWELNVRIFHINLVNKHFPNCPPICDLRMKLPFYRKENQLPYWTALDWDMMMIQIQEFMFSWKRYKFNRLTKLDPKRRGLKVRKRR